MRRRAEGFLFDVHEGEDAVVLWIYKNDGTPLRLEADFHPRIYARAERSLLRALGSELINRGLISCFRLTEGIEFWSGKAIEVGEYTIRRYENKRRVVDWLAAQLGESALYNADLDIPQYYLYWSDLFPLCQVEVEYERDHLDQIHCLSSLWETDYRLPDLRILEMKLSRSRFIPLGKGNSLVLGSDGRGYELEPRTWRELLEMVNGTLQRVDPDVILSEYGDENIFPSLIRAAKREKIPLGFDRDFIPTERAVVLDGKSYFSYGRILYKPPSYICFGRWHVDAANSFIVSETGLDGLIELSRLSRLPPQKVARTSPGTAMNSIECYQAFKHRILIPYQKAEPEKYKTAWELLVGDKGGLTYVQPIGAFENVAEIDYASMYPTLMMKKNLSPETVRCSCCSNVGVPEINYNVCEKREGLLPRALRPILELRRAYKGLKKKSQGKEREIYDRRQHALKWLLVTCFGYTGYRNARFGRIEAHEATTAWGRELLLAAKEMAEARGFHLLHALTDSLWITKRPMTEEEVIALCCDITRTTEIEMSLEGIYRWIVFLPSKENENRGVACRYFGRLQDQDMKVRGLLCRRHDTPPFIREAQLELLHLLGQAETFAECQEKALQAESLLKGWLDELTSGRVAPASLLITHRLSKAPGAYRVRTLAAEAAGQLSRARVNLHPGEMIKYLVVDSRQQSATISRSTESLWAMTRTNGRRSQEAERVATSPHPSISVSSLPPCRVLAEPFIEGGAHYAVEHYETMLRQAAEEVLSSVCFGRLPVSNFVIK